MSPRVGFAWQPAFAPRIAVRGGWGVYYERPSAGFKVDLQRAAPYFIYQNVPAPPNMADPYPRLNVNPFQIPLNVTVARDASGAASLAPRGRHGVSRAVALQREEQYLHRPARPDAVPRSSGARTCSTRRAVTFWSTCATSARAASGCWGRSISRGRSIRVETPVNGFTDIYDQRGPR